MDREIVIENLINPCTKGDLKKVQSFLSKFPDCVGFSENLPLKKACERGHLNIVKYLLASPDLKLHADPLYQEGLVLKLAAFHGNLDVVKYPTTSKEFDNPDIKKISQANCDNQVWKWITDYKSSQKQLKKLSKNNPTITEHKIKIL